jgi:CBS domain-containing protein
MTTAVIALRARDSARIARDNMKAAEIRHLPVVDDRNHVVGILSDRDLMTCADLTRIADVMTRRVRTVRPDTPAADAVALLIEHKIGSLPVVGTDEQLIGVITETDFLSIAQQALVGASIRARAEA